MKRKLIFPLFFLLIFLNVNLKVAGTDLLTDFTDTLNNIKASTDNDFMKMHCESIIKVINSRTLLPKWEYDLIQEMYVAFNNEQDSCSAKDWNTYIKRRRPLIISWTSPIDGYVSDAKLKLPKNWDPNKSYPLYVSLHGQTGDAQSSIYYIANPFISTPSVDSTFDDGYLLAPWGRGNAMYIKKAETDVWECIAEAEKYIKTDPTRKYLVGFSMGGYGVWHIGSKTPNVWAAFGIYAGVLAYDRSEYNLETAEKIKNIPTYIICGTRDVLYPSNEAGYNWLAEAGNPNLEFVTFDGDHEFYNSYTMDMYRWIRNFTNEDWNTSTMENKIKTQAIAGLTCYPNPVADEAVIRYTVEKQGIVELKIFNNLGQQIESVYIGEKVPGQYETQWIPKNYMPGLYYCSIISNHFIETIKINID